MIKVHIETRDGRWRDFKVRNAGDITREQEFLKIKTDGGSVIYINIGDIVIFGQTEVKP